MALEDSAKINLALKKIQGKAQTSNQKMSLMKALVQMLVLVLLLYLAKVYQSPSSSHYTIIGSTVEMVRFEVSPIAGTKDDV